MLTLPSALIAVPARPAPSILWRHILGDSALATRLGAPSQPPFSLSSAATFTLVTGITRRAIVAGGFPSLDVESASRTPSERRRGGLAGALRADREHPFTGDRLEFVAPIANAGGVVGGHHAHHQYQLNCPRSARDFFSRRMMSPTWDLLTSPTSAAISRTERPAQCKSHIRKSLGAFACLVRNALSFPPLLRWSWVDCQPTLPGDTCRSTHRAIARASDSGKVDRSGMTARRARAWASISVLVGWGEAVPNQSVKVFSNQSWRCPI